MLEASAISKDLAGHSQTLTLGDSSASLANSDTCSILSTLFQLSALAPPMTDIRDSICNLFAIGD
jgi:hypothetical protein